MARTAFALALVGFVGAGCVGTIGDPGGGEPDPSAPTAGVPGAPRASDRPGSTSGPAGAPIPPAPGSAGATPSSTGSTPPATAACASSGVVASPLRRLTRREFNNTVRDLLGETGNPAGGFVVDARAGLFDNNAGSLVTALVASQYADAADGLARAAIGKLATLAPCSTTAQDDGCARDFIRTFGKRVYRRP